MPGHAATLVTVVMIALLAGWMAPERATAAGCKDQKPTSWDVQAAPDSEPGERLIMSGRVISSTSGSPLPGITVYVYHADSKGNYQLPEHVKEPPRLCAILITNAKGEYRVRTSMPGGYEGYAPHVHFEIWGPHVSRQFTFVNLRLSPGPVADQYGRPVTRGADGILRCTKDLAVGVTK